MFRLFFKKNLFSFFKRLFSRNFLTSTISALSKTDFITVSPTVSPNSSSVEYSFDSGLGNDWISSDNSGEENIEKEIQDKVLDKKIKLIYIHRKLPRVGALNLAIDKSTSEFSLRFDTRSRFNEYYAFNALKVLNDENINAKVVGGVPSVISESNSFESRLCGELMSRSYIFFYPKHRNKK